MTVSVPRTAVRLACMLTVIGFFLDVGEASAQRDITSQIRDNENRLNIIRRERRQLQTELQSLRGTAHSISSELTNIESQKFATTRIVNELERQMVGLNAHIDTITIDLIVAQDALSEKRAVLNRRVTDIYKRGSLWAFQVLLAAESFGDLLSRYKYLFLVSRQDRGLVGEVERLRDRIESQRNELLSVRTALTRSRVDRGIEFDRYTELERQRRQRLRVVRRSAEQAEQQLGSLAQDEQRVVALIETLERARAAALARGRTPAATITDTDMGQLDWPLEGAVAYNYGRTQLENGTVVNQIGIGISAPAGTQVRAVARGRVAFAEGLNTWGQTILLDHGGYTTLYLFLSRIDVAPGQLVDGGAVIGLSGGETSEFGPHVEFQIRGETGIALDPRNWLRPRG